MFNTKELYTPNLIGKSLQESCEILSEKNLNIRILGRKEDPTLPPYTIISQTPQENEKIKPHQSVYVVITAQGSTCNAPNLIGRSRDEIKEQLEKLGIKTTMHAVPSPYPTNTCIAQSPAPGERIEENTITIYYAKQNNKQILWPNFIGKNLGVVKDLLATINISPQIISQSSFMKNSHAEQNEFPDSSIVLDQRPRAGTLLTLDENKPINVQLMVG